MSGEFWVREHRCYIRPSYKASPALLMMTKRSLLIFMLLVAFLLSAWGNVIAAAFCPRYMSLNSCINQSRRTKQVETKSCHHEMADMRMEDMPSDDTQMNTEAAPDSEVDSIPDNQPIQVVTESSIGQVAIDLPIEPCGHCWMHSQPSSGTSTVTAINPSPRSVEANAAPAEFQIVSPSAYPISAFRMEHGPPGDSLSRHVLINVFRI